MNDFLVSTIRGLFLVENLKPVKLIDDHNLYGITWNKDEMFLYSRQKAAILRWNQNKLKELKFRIDDGHQILWWNGALYVTNTGQNRIDIWKNGKIAHWQYRPTNEGHEHINSLYNDHSYFYVCEHKQGNLPVYIRIFDEDLNELDEYIFDAIRTDHNNGLHNIYIENGKLFTLSVNNLIVRDLQTGNDEIYDIRSQSDIGYLRGFARDNNYFYIGESRVCEQPDRRKGNSNVLILDNDFKIVKTINLEDSGQLHDIRLLKNDYAHNCIMCPKVWLNK